MPARRRRRKKSRSKEYLKYIKVFIIVLIIGLSLYYLKFSKRYWDGLRKLVLAVNTDNTVHIIIFNPQYKEIIDISIPGNTQVDVSRELGTWQLGSVWQLGKNEGYEGKLLVNTITKNFSFPVYLWSGESGLKLKGDSFLNSLRVVFSVNDTNLPILDRVSLALFSLGVRNTSRTNIDLSKTQYLEQIELADGEEGFRVKEKMPEKLSLYFSDPVFLDNSAKVIIRDATGKWGVSKNISKTVEVLGAKVVAVTDEGNEQINCKVNADNEYYLKLLNLLYGCQKGDVQSENIEMEIIIGTNFASFY